jgi:hypothetical protein
MDDVRPATERTEMQQTASRKPVVAFRFGRGRTGGSTMLDLLIQLARAAGRPVLIGDGDRRNTTLAGLYPPKGRDGARQPATDELPDLKDWLMELMGEAVTTRTSLVVDLGGGDRLMQEMGKDLGLIEFCEESGVEPVALYFTGPDMDDFEHVLAIWRAGYFRSRRGILFLNEHLVPQGRTPVGAFDGILARPEMEELVEGGIETVLLPRLSCLKEMRAAGFDFLTAASGKVRFDPMRAFMVKSWVKSVREKLAHVGADQWLP